MTLVIKESYTPIVIGANGTYLMNNSLQRIGGFLCITGGTLTITDQTNTVIVNALPVTAGVYYPLPFFVGTGASGKVVLAGGASGTLAI